MATTATIATVTSRSARAGRPHRTAPRRCRQSVGVRLRPAVSSGAAREAARPAPRLHLTARGRLVVLAVMALLLLAAFATGRSASSQAAVDPPSAPVALAQHTVAPGETLWTVARSLAPRRDTRDVVEQISRLNHLRTPALQAGQQLLLPQVR